MPVSDQPADHIPIKMTIIITTEKLIKEIQEEFNKLFPFLRIEFFIKSNYKSREAVIKASGMHTVANIYNSLKLPTIEISPCTIVKDFENDFENKFGMYVQLYRKSGNLWQEITITDTWTMKQQDRTGNEISNIINKGFRTNPPEFIKSTLIKKAV